MPPGDGGGLVVRGHEAVRWRVRIRWRLLSWCVSDEGACDHHRRQKTLERCGKFRVVGGGLSANAGQRWIAVRRRVGGRGFACAIWMDAVNRRLDGFAFGHGPWFYDSGSSQILGCDRLSMREKTLRSRFLPISSSARMPDRLETAAPSCFGAHSSAG
jgi:hypothetical protein